MVVEKRKQNKKELKIDKKEYNKVLKNFCFRSLIDCKKKKTTEMMDNLQEKETIKRGF